MNAPNPPLLDLVEELRLRRWARTFHVPEEEREPSWHPVILDEMRCKDAELAEQSSQPPHGRIAPLCESRVGFHAPHGMIGPRFLAPPLRCGELHYT